MSYPHWLTVSDLFYGTFNHDLGGSSGGNRGTHGYTVHYSVPWSDWLVGVTATQSSYSQSVAGYSQDYFHGGTSEDAGLRLSRLLWRDAVRKTMLSLKGWRRRSANFIDDTQAHRRGAAAFGPTPAPEEAYGEGSSRVQVTPMDLSLEVPFRLGNQSLRYTSAGTTAGLGFGASF